MAGYTKLNLKDDVEDQAPKFGLGGKLEARMARVPLELEHSGVSYQRLSPNFRVPFGHAQKTQEEVYVLVSGSLRANVAGEILELRPFDALRVSNETIRSFEAGPEGAELIAIGAPSTGPGDADVHEDWWGD